MQNQPTIKPTNFIAPLLFRGAAYKLSIRVGKHDLDLFSQACNGMNPSNVFRDRNRGGVPQLVFLYGSTPFLNRTSPEIPLILQWENETGNVKVFCFQPIIIPPE